jgi:hypothetical protein
MFAIGKAAGSYRVQRGKVRNQHSRIYRVYVTSTSLVGFSLGRYVIFNRIVRRGAVA